MGNTINNDLQKQADIFNSIWKESDYKLSVRKLKKIQDIIEQEYPFLATIEESTLVSHNLLKDYPIIYQNKIFTEMTQYTPQEILGRNCRFLQGPKSSKAVVGEMRKSIHKGEPVN